MCAALIVDRMALAARTKGEDRHAVAIIGDGSMTSGLAYEGLNQAGGMGSSGPITSRSRSVATWA